jgi:DNA mismatch repair protein MutS2
MKEKIINFIYENNLSPFDNLKTYIRKNSDSIFKTNDAKTIFNKVLLNLSSNFMFSQTSNLWNFFSFCDNFKEILYRQDFFKSLKSYDNTFLKSIKIPKKEWSPNYNLIVVTEDEDSFVKIQKLNCPVKYIITENDLSELETYDVVQVIDCDNFGGVLERLPQSVFIEDISNIYLERYLEELSGWKNNLLLLKKHSSSTEILDIVNSLLPLFDLIDTKVRNNLTLERAEEILEEINDSINEEIKDFTLSGDMLVKILGQGKMPPQFEKIINNHIKSKSLPEEIFNLKIPLELDYKELEKYIKKQNSQEFTSLSEEIRRQSQSIKQIKTNLKRLRALILFEDFSLGISNYLNKSESYPILSENLHFEESSNLFLDNPQKISFQLDYFSSCSILTGANSGGKTTLLEHILQLISLFYLGLPVIGRLHSPLFSDVYYFAKNKGSLSRGAFENLLIQMSKIKPGKKTLILADEIESVTEPGVAGKIIASSADFFIKKNCFLVIATHLGHEIISILPNGARIDGIEASGLDPNFNLIVDHNPVMGRLAHSTPELIVEKMAKLYEDEYFQFLEENLKKSIEKERI